MLQNKDPRQNNRKEAEAESRVAKERQEYLERQKKLQKRTLLEQQADDLRRTLRKKEIEIERLKEDLRRTAAEITASHNNEASARVKRLEHERRAHDLEKVLTEDAITLRSAHQKATLVEKKLSGVTQGTTGELTQQLHVLEGTIVQEQKQLDVLKKTIATDEQKRSSYLKDIATLKADLQKKETELHQIESEISSFKKQEEALNAKMEAMSQQKSSRARLSTQIQRDKKTIQEESRIAQKKEEETIEIKRVHTADLQKQKQELQHIDTLIIKENEAARVGTHRRMEYERKIHTLEQEHEAMKAQLQTLEREIRQLSL